MPARALLLAARMDLGRLIRFINQRTSTVADVKSYVASLRARADEEGVATIGHGELGERDRMLLSIAERAGAVRAAAPAGPAACSRAPPAPAARAWLRPRSRPSKNRGWESYRSIERYMSGASQCRRRQILDHFGDRSPTAPSGRCCDVCDPDPALARALSATPGRRPRGGGPPRARRARAQARPGRSPHVVTVRTFPPWPPSSRWIPSTRSEFERSAQVALRARRGQARVHRRGQYRARGDPAQAPGQRRGAASISAVSARPSAPSTATRCWRSSESCGGLPARPTRR